MNTMAGNITVSRDEELARVLHYFDTMIAMTQPVSTAGAGKTVISVAAEPDQATAIAPRAAFADIEAKLAATLVELKRADITPTEVEQTIKIAVRDSIAALAVLLEIERNLSEKVPAALDPIETPEQASAATHTGSTRKNSFLNSIFAK